jgi:enoyl-CoA hydratase/carnithine racemase
MRRCWAALDIASLIAQKSPDAVQGTKELLNWSRDHPIPEGKQMDLLRFFSPYPFHTFMFDIFIFFFG